MDKKMPELQFGDVVKFEGGGCGIVGNSRIYLLTTGDGLITHAGVSWHRSVGDHVVKIYRRGRAVFDQEDLRYIYEGTHPDLINGYIIWELPKVREMTVDQVSEALGYTVKIVGEKHA